MRCKKCHNEVEKGKFVCESCRKKTPSRKKDRSKKRVARRTEGSENNGSEMLAKVDVKVSKSENKNVKLEDNQKQIKVVKDLKIPKTIDKLVIEQKQNQKIGKIKQDESIKKENKRSRALFKGMLLFLSGVVIGVGGTISVSNKYTKSKTAVAETTESSDIPEQTESFFKTSMEQSSTFKKDTQVTEKEEVKKKKTPEKKSSNFTKELPDKIVEKVKGLKGYYSYYLHDLSEPSGVSGSSKKMLSASTIKLFILEKAFAQVKADKLELDEPYELLEEDKVPGTGDIQNAKEGTTYTTEDLLNLMIVDSDNTATNIIIDRLGGIEELSDYILDRGYGETILARKMGDTAAISEGKDNYTSVDDVGRLMSKLAKKELIGKAEDEKMLEILSNGKNHDKLAKHLPDNLTIYCKSGEYSDFGVQNDTILMEGPGGDYILTIMSEDGDESEQFSVMQSIGEEAYDLISKE